MNKSMKLSFFTKLLLIFHFSILMCVSGFANDDLFKQARALQREGRYDEAVDAYIKYLSIPPGEEDFTKDKLALYTDALVQLMNTFQSKGAPEAYISALQELYKVSPVLHKQCLRDYYSVMGYALSRTERMKEAEDTMLKVFTIPLYHTTPERYFRDYAYAAAVFYSNPNYQQVVQQGTVLNRAKAYQHLAQTFLKNGRGTDAEIMLDSMYLLLNRNDAPLYINLDYKPVLNHYLKNRNYTKVEQYTE